MQKKVDIIIHKADKTIIVKGRYKGKRKSRHKGTYISRHKGRHKDIYKGRHKGISRRMSSLQLPIKRPR